MKILHLFRTPVGGLFRHVCDLAAAQAERGYEVGVVYVGRRVSLIGSDTLGCQSFKLGRCAAIGPADDAAVSQEECGKAPHGSAGHPDEVWPARRPKRLNRRDAFVAR